MIPSTLTIPEFFDAGKVGAVWRIPYETRASQARDWARLNALKPASTDRSRTWQHSLPGRPSGRATLHERIELGEAGSVVGEAERALLPDLAAARSKAPNADRRGRHSVDLHVKRG